MSLVKLPDGTVGEKGGGAGGAKSWRKERMKRIRYAISGLLSPYL
jgi:hypothetical protein